MPGAMVQFLPSSPAPQWLFQHAYAECTPPGTLQPPDAGLDGGDELEYLGGDVHFPSIFFTDREVRVGAPSVRAEASGRRMSRSGVAVNFMVSW